MFEKKYNMTREENLFFAKRNLVDSIWKSVNLEGIAMTFPDTQLVCDGMSVSGYTIDEVNAVNDLKYAWQYLFQTAEDELDLKYIQKIHAHLGKYTIINAGSLRIDEVNIGGTEWVPDLPDSEKITEDMEKLCQDYLGIEYALEMMLYLAKGQFFYDGNKRLATIIANKILISEGCGILSIPQKYKQFFLTELVRYYETGERKKLKEFLYKQCITGLHPVNESEYKKQF